MVSVTGATRSALGLALLAIALLGACGGGGQESTSGSSTPSIPTTGPGDVQRFFQLTLGNRWGFNFSVTETGRPPTSGFEIMKATGWQSHTVRGAFAGALKKRLGLTVTSEKAEGGEREYRLA